MGDWTRPDHFLGAAARCQLLPFLFWLGGFLHTGTKSAEKVGTLVLTSLLEDLAFNGKRAVAKLGRFPLRWRTPRPKWFCPGTSTRR